MTRRCLPVAAVILFAAANSLAAQSPAFLSAAAALPEAPEPVASLPNAPLPDAPLPASQAAAQTPQPTQKLPQAQTAPQAQQPVTVKSLPINILRDQRAIWTSPFHLHTRDLAYLAPFAALSAVSIGFDHDVMKNVISHDPDFNQRSADVSNGLIFALLTTPAISWGTGLATHDDAQRQAGLVGAESVADSLVVEEGLKLVFLRERPLTDNARGRFFQTSAGFDSSFPSSHSVVAWATATAMASQTHSRVAQVTFYSIASAVSLARVGAQEHFPTDVLVGSATGYLIGRYVAHRHHVMLPRHGSPSAVTLEK